MNPPKPLAIRQNSAQVAKGHRRAVARGHRMGEPVGAVAVPAGAAIHDCYPSFSPWPVRYADGSFLSGERRQGAAFRQPRFFRCCVIGIALRIGTGIPPNRGRDRCSRPSSLWQFLPRPLPLAGPMTPNAPLSGRVLVQRWLTPLAMTCLPGRFLGPGWGCLSSKAVLTSAPVGDACERGLIQVTILKRGSKTCTNPSQHSPCLWSLQDATARSIPIAPDWARLGADFSVPSPITILQKAPLLAVFWALWPQIRGCAANVIDRDFRFDAVIRAIRGIPRVALGFASPVRGRIENLWGDQCSRKS